MANQPPTLPAAGAANLQLSPEISEPRYRRLFETAQDAILILDADRQPATIMDANPFVLDLLGYTLDELVGKELWQIGLFSDKAESQVAMERLRKTGYIRYHDIPLETKQGTPVEVELVSNTYMVDGRNVIQCTIRVITERTEAAIALVASEERYRRLFETAQDAILILEEKSGKIVDANPFVIDMLGYPLDELVGKELWEIGLFSDQDESRAAMERLQDTGYIRYEDMPLETKLGRRVEVEFVSNSYMVGELKVIQCNIRDITDRKKAEEAARISAERFRFLAEAVPLMIFTATPDGNVDYVNRQLIEFTGSTSREACSSGPMNFAHADEVEEHTRKWAHSMATGEPFQHECRLLSAAGVYRWFLTRASALRDAGGAITLWIGSSTDIEDRKKVEENLVQQYRESEALNRAKDEFLATSSHELRTPLTSILGWSELLLSGDLDAKTQLVAIESIRQSAQTQSRLIDDMLDVSRLLTGKLELTRELVEVAATLLLTIRTIMPAAENKNIRIIEESFAHGAPSVYGDPTRLQQIFWNILSNAVKFTPQGGLIKVRFSSDGTDVEIAIKDTGAGISPEFLPRVFESLSQGGGSSTRQYGGLGLGLSIVKQLVEMHGGTVRAESEGLGKGSTFTVTLPARGVAATRISRMMPIGAADEPPVQAKIRLPGVKALMVDDALEMRTMVATVLRGAGATVVTASSAAEAFDRLTELTFDVLVSDIAMPAEDGHALVRRLRARSGERGRIPAVALTAFGGPLERELALEAGFNDYVRKPFTPHELLRAIAGLVGAP
ncbi:MAG: PAS domain S-box protein [Acidobacteria bacterium]|nr:PAS domain S-box protein [Acidobacteriota bacterium]